MDYKAQRPCFRRSKTALKSSPTLHCCYHCGGCNHCLSNWTLTRQDYRYIHRKLGHPTIHTLKIHPNKSMWLSSGFVEIKITFWHRLSHVKRHHSDQHLYRSSVNLKKNRPKITTHLIAAENSPFMKLYLWEWICLWAPSLRLIFFPSFL